MAAAAHSAGPHVGICKPVQTGLGPGEPGDAQEAARLSGVRRVLEVRRLSDTELTVRAVEAAGLCCAGVVIGSWPAEPEPVERLNLEDLPRLTGVPVLGRLPESAGELDPDEFTRRASEWFSADLITSIRRNRRDAR